MVFVKSAGRRDVKQSAAQVCRRLGRIIIFQTTARIPTAHGSRYLQKLCKHWRHDLTVAFTPLQGEVVFPHNARGAAWPGDATLVLQADAESFDCRLEPAPTDNWTR